MESLNEMFFSSAEKESITYEQILADVQRYCTLHHADKLSTEGDQKAAQKLLICCIYHF